MTLPKGKLARLFDADDAAPISWYSTAAIIIFCVLMLCVPWQELWNGRFIDRTVYLNKFTVYLARPRFFDGSVLAFIVNEVFFEKTILLFAGKLNVPLEVIFGAISFLCLFVYSKYLASRHGLLALIFLINPLIVEFAFSQLRMALAVSLLMLALFRKKQRVLAVVLAALACSIHTASFLIVFIYVVAKFVSARLAARSFNGLFCWLALIGAGLAVVMLIGPFRGVILSSVGDRRAEYSNVSQSIMYASFWMLLLLMTGTQKKKYFQTEGNAVAVVFLSVYAGATAFNTYNSRFLAASFPFIVSSMLALSLQKRVIIMPVYFLYAGAQWYYWLNAGRGR
jgi:hypothetical protein